MASLNTSGLVTGIDDFGKGYLRSESLELQAVNVQCVSCALATSCSPYTRDLIDYMPSLQPQAERSATKR